jgi:aryl-alcohol dehydrogenase-like predicted oxidoreductase
VVELSAISPIGFGAFKIGRNEGIKYDKGYVLPDGAAAERLLNGVLDLGINFIDTAPAYGLSEERIGQCIGHRRGEFVLATKVGERFEGGESRYDFSRTGMTASIEESLRRLRTECVDLLWLHSSKDDMRVLRKTDAVEVTVEARRRGWAKHIGLSGYTAAGFRAAFDWCDAVMATYHAEDRALAEVMREAAMRGITVIVKKGLASGRLSGPEGIRFVLSNKDVKSVVVGSLRLEHMEENVAAAREVKDWEKKRD